MGLITLKINGSDSTVDISPADSVNYVIREKLGLTGTKRGCETGGCGSCTVIVDGRAVYSCMMYALQAEGKEITTIEGLSSIDGKLDPVQESFMKNGGLQCGFCTPGFILAAKALLIENPQPNDSDIRDALVGNLCRCTGYTKIFESIRAAARLSNARENSQA